MVQIQVSAVEHLAAILAGIFVALENVVPGEFNFLLGQPIEDDQEDDAGDANSEGDGTNAFRVRFLLGNIAPFVEVVSLERTIARVQDDLGVALEQQSEGAPGGADIDRLPQAVQHEHLLVEKQTHNQSAPERSIRRGAVSTFRGRRGRAHVGPEPSELPGRAERRFPTRHLWRWPAKDAGPEGALRGKRSAACLKPQR